MSGTNRVLPGVNDVGDDLVKAHAMFDLRENKRPAAAYLLCVAFHHLQIRANTFGQAGLVDDE